ncbi:hypothetical protein D3C86_1527920 [compost metagenome]
MAVVDRGCLAVAPGAMRGPVMRMLRRIAAEADDITAAPRIIPQHIRNLPFGKCPGCILLHLVAHPVRIDKSQKRLSGRIAQRPPLVQMRKSPRSISNPVGCPVHSGGPKLHIPFRGLNKFGIFCDARQQQLGTVMLVIPGLCPLITPLPRLIGAPRIARGYGFVQISLVAGRHIQPDSAPA